MVHYRFVKWQNCQGGCSAVFQIRHQDITSTIFVLSMLTKVIGMIITSSLP